MIINTELQGSHSGQKNEQLLFRCFCVVFMDRTCFSWSNREERHIIKFFPSNSTFLILISIPAFPMVTGLLFRQGRRQAFDSATRWGRKRRSSGKPLGSRPHPSSSMSHGSACQLRPAETSLMTFLETGGNETTYRALIKTGVRSLAATASELHKHESWIFWSVVSVRCRCSNVSALRMHEHMASSKQNQHSKPAHSDFLLGPWDGNTQANCKIFFVLCQHLLHSTTGGGRGWLAWGARLGKRVGTCQPKALRQPCPSALPDNRQNEAKRPLE